MICRTGGVFRPASAAWPGTSAAPDRLPDSLLWFLLHPAPGLLERHARQRTAHAALIAQIVDLLAGNQPTAPPPARPRPPLDDRATMIPIGLGGSRQNPTDRMRRPHPAEYETRAVRDENELGGGAGEGAGPPKCFR